MVENRFCQVCAVGWRVAVLGSLLALTAAPAPVYSQEPAEAAEAESPVEPAPDPLQVEGDELEASLEALEQKIQELQASLRTANEADTRVLEERLWRAQLERLARVRSLASNVRHREDAGEDVSAHKAKLADRLKRSHRGVPEHFRWREAQILKLREARDAAAGADLVNLETRLSDSEAKLQRAYREILDLARAMEQIGLDAGSLSSYASEHLQARAEILAARTNVLRGELAALGKRAASNQPDAEINAQMQELQARLDRQTDNLSSTIALMARLDLATAEYQQLLIQTTGELTTDILDTEVLMGLARSWRDQARESLTTRGPGWFFRALIFMLILAAFRVLSAITSRLVRRAVRSSKVSLSQLLRDTLVSWSSRLVMAIGVLVALSQLGFQIGPLLAGLGIAGFIVGFALQDSLANFAAGAMILLYRPFDVGDVIEAAGVSGSVRNMSLVSTTIHTFDNQTLIVPNNRIWGDVIRNVTAQDTRRVDLVFGVGYQEDIERVEKVLQEVLASHDKVLDDPAPIVKVHKLAESAVEFVVRPWALTIDYWDVYWDLTRDVKLRFDREGIKIPFPQREVHLPPAEAPPS